MKYTEKTEEEKKKKIKCKISIFRMEKKERKEKIHTKHGESDTFA